MRFDPGGRLRRGETSGETQMTPKDFVPIPIAAALLGATLVAAPPAAAQQDRWQGRDWRDSADPYDRYMGQQRWRQDNRQGEAMPGADREAFARGYRAGREDERRRSMQSSGADAGAQAFGGGGRDDDWWIVVPDILPDTPRYRGMQDFALMPDYSRSVDWLRTAAQSLREAIQAMAQQPPSERRNQAIRRANEALIETQQAMVRLPPELRQR
jgi:hypothetical protein